MTRGIPLLSHSTTRRDSSLSPKAADIRETRWKRGPDATRVSSDQSLVVIKVLDVGCPRPCIMSWSTLAVIRIQEAFDAETSWPLLVLCHLGFRKFYAYSPQVFLLQLRCGDFISYGSLIALIGHHVPHLRRQFRLLGNCSLRKMLPTVQQQL